MPTLGGTAGTAVIDMSVENNSGTDARTDGGIKNVAVSASSTPSGLGQCGGVGIIIDDHGNAVVLRNLGSQREIPPAGKVGWINDDSGLGIQRTWRANADASD